MQVSKRHLDILKFVQENPGCSTNKIYIATSPVCQRTGRKQSTGTCSWTIPRTLEKLGLIIIKVNNSRRERFEKKHKSGIYDSRFQVRYHWYLTAKGTEALRF